MDFAGELGFFLLPISKGDIKEPADLVFGEEFAFAEKHELQLISNSFSDDFSGDGFKVAILFEN